jgi:hypothetical protein
MLFITDSMQARDILLNNHTQLFDLMRDLTSTHARVGPYLETYGDRSEAAKMAIQEWLRYHLLSLLYSYWNRMPHAGTLMNLPMKYNPLRNSTFGNVGRDVTNWPNN